MVKFAMLDALDTRTLSDRGVDMQVKHVGTNDPVFVTVETVSDGNSAPECVRIPFTLRLLGPDADKYLALQRQVSATRMQRAQDASRSAGTLDPATEMRAIDEEEVDMLAAITVAWTGVLGEDLQAIPCTPDNVRAMFRQFPAVRDQASRFVQNRVNFLLQPAGG